MSKVSHSEPGKKAEAAKVRKGNVMAHVDFDVHQLTEEDRAILDTVNRFGDEVMRPVATALDTLTPDEVIAEGSTLFDAFKKYHANGFHAMGFPPEVGGIEVGHVTRAMIAEKMGYSASDLAISFGASTIPFTLAMLSTDPQVQQLAVDYCADTEGKLIGCWGITEPDHGSDLLMHNSKDARNPKMSGQVRAELVGDEYVLNGQKAAWVSNGNIATHCGLWVCVDPTQGVMGNGIAVIPLDLPGITRGKPLNKLGQRALNQGEIFFNDVRIPRGFMISEDGMTSAMLSNMQLAGANTGMALTFTGTAQAAFDEAFNYAQERVQGGVPIIEHQNIQLKLFSMYAELQSARAISRKVSGLLNALSEDMTPPPVHLPIAAKITCTNAAFRLASEAIQVHGGNGLSKEYPIEKIFRDARASMIEDGVNESLALAGLQHLRDEVPIIPQTLAGV